MGIMDKTGDAETAARTVTKYLYAYSDKAPLDRTAAKFAGFWTWQRRTVPLMIAELGRQPGKLAAVGHAQLQMAASAEPQEVPQWAVDQGLVPVGGDMLAGADLPPYAAAEAFDPRAGALINRFGGLLPSLGKAVVEEQTQESLFTGGKVQGSYPRRLAEAAFPSVGKVERSPVVAQATGDDQAAARILSAFGLTARVNTPPRTRGGSSRSGGGIYGG
jgi:hypothetical protein